MTKSFVALIVIIALTVEPVTAGMLYSGLSDADAASIKRMGVVSALGDTLMIRSMGLTIFNNKTFKATLSNRDFDESFGARMKGTIAASGKVRGEVAILTTPSLETESLIAAAREQGFDAIVAMQPAEDTQFHMTGPGLTVFRSGGGQKAFTCNSMRIVVIRIADAKQIASASDYQCPSFSNLPFWHETWQEFTDEERQIVSDAMKVFVDHQIDQTLKKLKLHAS